MSSLLRNIATREAAIQIANDLCDWLPRQSDPQKSTNTGRTEWTRAVWSYFNNLQTQYSAHEWVLFPATPPSKGRVVGEYIVDFTLFDPKLGCRIACESEWADIDRIDWAFDKLRSVKADIKILIFQWDHTEDGQLPTLVMERIRPYLANTHHHHPNREHYLLLQWQEETARIFLWTPQQPGPFVEEPIYFEPVS